MRLQTFVQIVKRSSCIGSDHLSLKMRHVKWELMCGHQHFSCHTALYPRLKISLLETADLKRLENQSIGQLVNQA